MHTLPPSLTLKLVPDWNASIIKPREVRPSDTFAAFLKETKAEYRIREAADLDKFRQEFITKRLNQESNGFSVRNTGRRNLLTISNGWEGCFTRYWRIVVWSLALG